MSWLEGNLAALGARQAALAEQLAATPDAPEIHIEPARAGGVTGWIDRPGQRPLRLGSRVDPRREAERSLEGLALDFSHHQFHFGFGLGYTAERLLAKLSGRHLLLMVAEERTETLRAVFSARDLRPFLSDPRVFFFVGPGTRRLLPQFWEDILRFVVFGLDLSDNPSAVAAAPEWYAGLRNVVRDAMQSAKAGLQTKFVDGVLFLENCLSNAPYLLDAPPAARLLDFARGKPAIVVAAGPSLDKNVDLLRDARDRALILCVDTAYRNLTSHGIVPHAVLCIDPRDNSWKHFRDVAEPTGAHLIFDPEANHLTVRSFGGPRLSVGLSKSDLTRWLDDVVGGRGQISKGSNVMLAGFIMARSAGADPIIMIGCDLAYPREEGASTHAGGTAFAQRYRRVERDGRIFFRQPHFDDPNQVIEFEVRMVDGVDGAPVPTTAQLYTYLSMLEAEVAQGGPRVIDATEGGARIAGTEIQTLAEALAACPAGAVPLPEQIEIAPESGKSRTDLVAALERLEGELLAAGGVAAEGMKLCARVLEANGPEARARAAALGPQMHKMVEFGPVQTIIEQGAAAEVFAFLRGGVGRIAPDATPAREAADFHPAFQAGTRVAGHFLHLTRAILAELRGVDSTPAGP